MSKKIIAIDVDLCVIDPAFGKEGLDWFSWLGARSSSFKEGNCLYEDLENNICDYNLANYFNLLEGVDPMDFWRQPTLYCYLKPKQQVLEVVNRLCAKYEIIFVSYCKTGHTKSKYLMLKKYFPKMKGFLATKEKGYVKCDVAIDDRNSFLNQYTDCHKIKIETPYTQEEELQGNIFTTRDWYEIEDYIGKIL